MNKLLLTIGYLATLSVQQDSEFKNIEKPKETQDMAPAQKDDMPDKDKMTKYKGSNYKCFNPPP